jgi:antitoxin (DNA-binding transcriptional repressor) of toxin-antitoxin stability system
MTRMTVSQVRLHWTTAEKALAKGEEIVVTRNAKPVARLLPFPSDKKRASQRFDPALHMRKLRRFWQGKPEQPSVDELLAQDRADRTP